MGIYSTASIWRTHAERFVRELDPEKLSDKQLEQILFLLVGDMSFHNFNIHREGYDVSPGGLIDASEIDDWLERLYEEAKKEGD